MSRLFAGGTDLMTYSQPSGSPAMNDALSLLMVVKIATASDNTWLSFMEFERTGGAIQCGLLRAPTGGSIGEIKFVNTVATLGGTTAINISDADGWMLLAITRSTAAGTTFYKIPIGGATTTFAGGALADGLAWDNVLKIGGDDDPANFYWAAGAYWNGTELSQSQIEGVASAKTTASIDALNPTWLADDSDAFATNLTDPGNGDRTAISGTSDDADDPSGWVYGLGGLARPYISISVA